MVRWLCSWTCLVLASCGADRLSAAPPAKIWAEIRVVDRETGRGVPLVELETVNNLIHVTDNAGRIAFHEPGLMGRQVFFFVRSHGYEAAKDGFGIRGVRLTLQPGQVAEIKLTRKNLAERLCRLTGEGIYRDSVLLGYPIPPPSPNPGNVGGQDSVQTAIYRGKVFWLWGDTHRMDYALGLFRMAGATTNLFNPADQKSDPGEGIPFNYFVDSKSGFARAMMPLPERPQGVVWISALAVVPDGQGNERMVGHYTRRKSLSVELEHGIAMFNDAKSGFESVKQLPLDETWRRPSGHPIPFEEDGKKWFVFGSPTPNVRVPATLAAILDPTAYEAFTCLRSQPDGKAGEPQIGIDGKPEWRWQKQLPPLSSNLERRLVESKKIRPEHARYCPADSGAPDHRITLHNGSVRWNAYRKKWVLLAGQAGGKTSYLGEVWYSEADHPTGPFSKAVHVVSHDRQTFYNVCHHSFLDRDGGRVIHFEGTYTNEFSGNTIKTPRYNYNQVLYRLDLSALLLR